MSKKLAIKGHSIRGKEVIELLKKMGGKNTYGYNGEMESLYFSIYNDAIIYGSDRSFLNDNYVFFTLEEFLEKFPFKVGDKVIDKADGCTGVVCEMKWDEDVSDMKYCVAFGYGVDFGWFANDSIEFYKENKNLMENKFPSFEPMFKMSDEFEYKIPDGYEITEVSKDKVFIKPIKSKYPTTYEDCCKTLDIRWEKNYTQGYKCGLISKFQELYIARSAFWKIAGEQMGLGKPWEPDWTNLDQLKYCIMVDVGEFITMTNVRGQHFLAFPTEEMRDIFYENFKDLIEQCKELL